MFKVKRPKITPEQNPELFKQAVRAQLHTDYLMSGDVVAKGQAVTYLAAELRDQYGCYPVGWRLPANQVDLASVLEEHGFVLAQGRHLRMARAGGLTPYGRCVVVLPADWARLARKFVRAEPV